MKTIYLIITLLSFFTSAVSAKRFSISVGNIRNDKGNILVMLQASGQSKPVYEMSKARKGEVTITIEEAPEEAFVISVFHDENENWQMDMDELGKPAEGFAREKHHPEKEDACKLKLFYFDNSSDQ